MTVKFAGQEWGFHHKYVIQSPFANNVVVLKEVVVDVSVNKQKSINLFAPDIHLRTSQLFW